MELSGAIPILAVNGGSSSLKFALFAFNPDDERQGSEQVMAEGAIEEIGQHESHLWVKTPSEILEDFHVSCPDWDKAVDWMLKVLTRPGLPLPLAIGHRFVSGGPHALHHQMIGDSFQELMQQALPYAPLHVPLNMAIVEAVTQRFPDMPQAACFDTVFHRDLPEIASRLPLPRDLWDRGMRKYGFHGLSYEYIVDTLGDRARGRVIIAHLGNGSSLAAISNGRSLDTTMGLTPTGGVIMGTRPGDLDPGALLFLMNVPGYEAPQLSHVLNHLSGLMGISAMTGDMAALLASSDPHANQAVEMFAYSIRKAIGALTAALGGIDTLVFTGGIGEHVSAIRQKICEPLAFCHIELDDAANEHNARIISRPSSLVQVAVIPTNENLMIARHTYQLWREYPQK